MKLESWLNKNFGVTGSRGKEVNFPCPKCRHPDFSFNLEKKLGYCFRASCHWAPSLKELNVLARTKIGTNLVLTHNLPQEGSDLAPTKISLPRASLPLLARENNVLITRYPKVVADIANNRGVSPANQYRFDFHFDGSRIYIPVYFKGELINYVGRAYPFDRQDIKRYSYCPGANTRDTLFNWDQMKNCEYVTLVENTFNGIWLMDAVNGTTNFGSDLSVKQIDLIKLSKVKTVVIMWDEGANRTAAKAVTNLRRAGVNAVYLNLEKQPDDHTREDLTAWVEYALTQSKKGATMVDTTA